MLRGGKLAAVVGGGPLRITINGITYERATLEGQFLFIGGQPAYVQVS